MTTYVEKGDIYFFYRPKVDSGKVSSIDDIQRFFIVLAADEKDKARLFLVGKKRMPKIPKGKSKSTAREWMMNTLTGKPKKIGEALVPLEYETKTKGKQKQGEAIPVGEGRYAIVERDDSTRLGYRLSKPGKPGKAQKELGILAEAIYVISVRNPSVDVRGFPDDKPDYPKTLNKKFADKRWIDVDDSRLLNYENAQLLLIGAHTDLSEEEIKITGKAGLFRTLGLKKRDWPTDALENGKFAKPQMKLEASEPSGDLTKGGKRGGKAATKKASASGIAQALKGIDLPCKKSGLVKQAKSHKASDDIIKVLKEFPDREYKTMSDIQKAVGEVR